MRRFDLTGKVAIVTGGNGGIGLGIARGLLEAGASVMLAGRNAAKGAAAVADLGAMAAFTAADITAKQACTALVAVTVERFGRLDILVNNAGTSIRKPPQDFSEAEWHQIMDTNVTAAFLMAQAAYGEFRRAGGGKIVSIGSLNSLMAAPHNVPYTASKGAIVQMTRGLAMAWAGDNIQANTILPGWIDTEMTATARAHVPGLDQTVATRTPAGRWGRPEDLAGLAVFLASAASDFVTGTAIPADGGYSVRA